MKKLGTLVVLLVTLALGAARPALAVHYRGAIFTWRRDLTIGTYGVTFVVPFTVKRSNYSGSYSDGYPAVGDKILENIGGTYIAFGDSQYTSTLYIRVIAIDVINDTMTGYLEESNSVTPGEIKHAYPGVGPFTAAIDTCCRIEEDPLNPLSDYRLESILDLSSLNRCPVTNFVSNVDVQRGTTLNFALLTTDPDSDPRTFRLSTSAESGLADPIPGLGVGASTGLVTWTVPSTATLGPYGTQIMVEDAHCKVPVDFTVTVRLSTGNAQPTFDQPPSPCNQTLQANVGSPLGFTVRASDPDVGNSVTLNNTGLPTGATFVSTPANPSTGTFSWTPGVAYMNQDFGPIAFTATDGSISAVPCLVGIHVNPPLNFPNVTGMLPTSGPSVGGQSVTITGSKFQNGVTVKLGGVAAQVTGSTATSITATTGPHPAGHVELLVTNPDGGYAQVQNAYEYLCSAPVPTASVSAAPGAICVGASKDLSVALTGTPPWKLLWSDGAIETGIATSPHVRNVSPSATTQYTVDVVADANCAGAGSGTAEVTVNAVSSAIAVRPALCPSATATASVPDAGPGAVYDWSITNGSFTGGTGTRTVTFTVGSLGTLHLGVTVTANGCSSSSGVDVPVEPAPTAALTGSTTICDGTPTNLTVELTGTPHWRIKFSDGFEATNVDESPYVRSVAPSSNITYTITEFEDEKGCGGQVSGSASITVLPSPSATMTVAPSVCRNSTGNAASVPDAGSGATYLWGITNGTITGGQGTRSITFSVGVANPVTLTVSVTKNTCTRSSSQEIQIFPQLTATLFGNDSAICPGGSVPLHVELTGTPPWHLTWSDGAQQTVPSSPYLRFVSPSQSHTYTITSVTDASGCPGSSSGSVKVTIASETAVIAAANAVCPSSQANTASVPDAGPGATYEWLISGGFITGGADTRTVTFNAGNGPTLTLYVTVNVPPGCIDQDSKQMSVGVPGATIIGSSTVFAAPSANVSVSLSGTPPWKLTWSDQYVQDNIQTSPAVRTITPLRTTTYTLSSVQNGTCTGNVSGSVQVIPQGVCDVNADTKKNVSDVLYYINYLFAGGPAPLRSGDCNSDNAQSVSDVLYLINYLFAGGPAPPA